MNTTLHDITLETFATALGDYPVYPEGYRDLLTEHIFNYYEWLPISFHNVEKWLSYFKAKLDVIMPKYNHLYRSLDLLEDEEFLPLRTMHTWKEFGRKYRQDDETDYSEKTVGTLDTTFTDNRTTTDKGTSKEVTDDDQTYSKSGTNYKYYADFPQGVVSTNEVNINQNYLTNWTKEPWSESGSSTDDKTVTGTTENTQTNVQTDKTDTDTTGTKTSTTTYGSDRTTDEDTHEYGTNTSSYSELVQAYRDLAINIDLEIIKDLSDMFQTVFSHEALDESEDYIPINDLPLFGLFPMLWY